MLLLPNAENYEVWCWCSIQWQLDFVRIVRIIQEIKGGTYNNIQVVLYRYETWTLTLKEEVKLDLIRKIFYLKKFWSKNTIYETNNFVI